MIEKEIKFEVKDIISTLNTIRDVASFSRTEYIRDIIFGTKEGKKKIRMRITDNFLVPSIEVIYKNRARKKEQGVKVEIEEMLYKGNNVEDAMKAIKKQGDFSEENSYEKMRVIYLADEAEITLDVYPYGVWIEIEGEEDAIWKLAKKWGLKKHPASLKTLMNFILSGKRSSISKSNGM